MLFQSTNQGVPLNTYLSKQFSMTKQCVLAMLQIYFCGKKRSGEQIIASPFDTPSTILYFLRRRHEIYLNK